MSALRDWARLDARWYADPVVRAAAASAPEVMVLWPVLVGMAKHESHADNNPDGVIVVHLDDLAHNCRRTPEDTHAAINALDDAGLIWHTTEAHNAIRISLNGFAKWQTARRSNAERLANKRWRDDAASREKDALRHGHEMGATRSRNASDMPDVDGDVDKKEIEPTALVGKEPTPKQPSQRELDIQNVYDYWIRTERETGGIGSTGKGRQPGPKPTRDRRTKINARLAEGYTPADLKQAIAFYCRDPHHLGDNPQSTRYTDLTTTLKSASKVDAGIAGYANRKGSSSASLFAAAEQAAGRYG